MVPNRTLVPDMNLNSAIFILWCSLSLLVFSLSLVHSSPFLPHFLASVKLEPADPALSALVLLSVAITFSLRPFVEYNRLQTVRCVVDNVDQRCSLEGSPIFKGFPPSMRFCTGAHRVIIGISPMNADAVASSQVGDLNLQISAPFEALHFTITQNWVDTFHLILLSLECHPLLVSNSFSNEASFIHLGSRRHVFDCKWIFLWGFTILHDSSDSFHFLHSMPCHSKAVGTATHRLILT